MGPQVLKLTAVTAAITVILFAADVQITNANQQQQQQQSQQGSLQLFLQQLLTSQPGTVKNGTTTIFQSTNDSFSIHIPQGWIIQDRNNTGFTLAAEVLDGYGLLAQLCPAQQQQQQEALLINSGGNASNISNRTSNNDSCQRSQEIIHVIRYPNLGARLGFASDNNVTTTNNSNLGPDTILAFQMLKLQDIGYHDIKIVNSTDKTINVISSVLNNKVIATVPAKFVEMTYSTNFAPNGTRTGYFLSTATNATSRNLGMTTGYGIFYEQSSTTTTATTTAGETTIFSRSPPPTPVMQVFDSFELLAGAEVEQSIVAALYGLAAQAVEQEVTAADILRVEIDSNVTEGVAPATFEFEADISGGTEPYSIGWDLNDDGVAESNEQKFVVTFNEAGTYNGVLTVADIEGRIASDTVEITVEEGENEEVSTEQEDEDNGELSPRDDEDKGESLTEERMQEQNSCDSFYLLSCISSSPLQSTSTCNDSSTRNSESRLPQDPQRVDGNNDNSSDDTECGSESNQAGFGVADNKNFGSENLLDLYGSGST
jgi:PKD repeat protein